MADTSTSGLTGAGAPEVRAEAPDRQDLSARVAAWVFALVVVVAVPILFHAAREQWFFLDEWDFLADRDLLSLDDLLRPHNEHWSTGPIILYRLVWQVVGLHDYWPYLALAIGAHLVLAVLLRLVMVRAGAHPWIATAGASLFVLFGGGREDITWGFQVGFTGALAFGVAALLLADHDDRSVGRDVGAVACAVAALTFSGLGITTAVALGASVALRRGLRAAALLVAPTALVFAAWYLGWGKDGRGSETTYDDRVLRLVGDIVESTFGRIGAVTALGWLLGLAAAVGLVLVARREGLTDLRREKAPVLGLVVGAVAFLAITGVGRASLSLETTSRYRHVLFALLLPAVGIGLTELGRRWRPATWVAVALLVAAVPVNVRRFELEGEDRLTLGAERLVLAIASTEAPAAAPDALQPLPNSAPEITVGWLEQIRADGKVPEPTDEVLALRPTAEVALALEQERQPAGEGCRELGPLEPARLAEGAVLRVPASKATVTEVRDGEPTLAEMTYLAEPIVGPRSVPAADGPEVRLRALRPMVLRVRAAGARRRPEVCEG